MDGGIEKYFYFIKEKVSSDWKNLAYQLGVTQADIENIASKNQDDKSCCMDLLHEWLKQNGEKANIEALFKGLSKAKLQSTVDELKKLYPETDAQRQSAQTVEISELHSKLGFKVEDLKLKEGGKPVRGSIPLILPNDLKYNASTGEVEKVHGVPRKTLQVVPEALDLLEGIEEPVSVLAICGPCRTGKSYILSRLLGTPDAFELGHSMDPQTIGIRMGTKVLRGIGKDFTIVLLDTEGIDAVGASAGQDASILVLTILLSSCLIYNSLNVPYKGDLEKMQCFTQLAKRITVKRGEETQTSAFHEFFPDFLWLLRDVSKNMPDKNGKEMDPTEYLKTKVLQRDGDEDGESTSGEVGQAIRTFFKSVECAKLEGPSVKKEVMNNIAQHTDSLNPEFNKGVHELTGKLLLKSRVKRTYNNNSEVTGVALRGMTMEFVNAVNDPNSILAMDNTWKNTVDAMRVRGIEEAVEEYNKQMKGKFAAATKERQLPLEESSTTRNPPKQPTLMDIHNEVSKKVTKMLLKKVGNFCISSEDQSSANKTLVDRLQQHLVRREDGPDHYVAADGTIRKQEGLRVTGGELFYYIQKNKDLSKRFCKNLLESLLNPIRKQVESPDLDLDDFDALKKKLDHAEQQYEEEARGPEKSIVQQTMTEHQRNLRAEIEKISKYQSQIRQAQQREDKLREQVEHMKQTQQEELQKMERQHREQIEKEKRELEDLHNDELLKKNHDLQSAKEKHMKALSEKEETIRKKDETIRKKEQELADVNRNLTDVTKQLKDSEARARKCIIS